ncbi:TPA: restriction endonuclease subunit S [Vibrio parahaemolyticus]|nr:hypothetical protein [Vibrio parahaemolyticus]HCE5236967.1 restriction endonuclease subunit S [Vibrio parahaemolyticus]
MNRQVKLSDIASVRLGKPFKTAVEDKLDKGDVFYLPIGDINTGKILKESSFARLVSEFGDERYFVEPLSILLPLRGLAMNSLMWKNNLSLPVLTSSHVAIIDCDVQKVNPFYLQWYLNSHAVKKYFDSVTEGSNIKKLTKSILGATPIHLPNMDVQERIGKIHENWLEQKSIHEKIIENGNIYFNEVCYQLSSGRVL